MSSSSFDFDNLFSLCDDINLQNKCDQYFILHDNIMEEIMPSLSQIDQYQLQTLSNNNSIQKSQRLNLECRVCGASARGYNFDQITCESCKAFFRRNALRDMSQLKCRYYGHCVITIGTRRQCGYCRLKKCFDIKMRKDWIRTDEEKKTRYLRRLTKEQKKTNDQQSLITLPINLQKKKHLMLTSKNREFVVKPIYKMSHFGCNHILHDADRILLNNINNAYQLVINKNDYSYIYKYTSSTSLLQFMNDDIIMYESLINFFKLIPEFKQLDIHDQIILIKSNFINIIHLHHTIIHNFQDCSNLGKRISEWIGKDFHDQMLRTRQYFYRFMNYPLLLKLTLIVFIFSVNLSASYDDNQFYEYKNQKILYEFQNFYTTILWRYLNYLFDEKQAIQAMEIIVLQILRYQLLVVTLENYLRQNPDCHKFHSLIQSIFGLT
ncbi:unnamed protein product [Rotaria sordida]|uniref:Nuclear receptor domain-containing protein n=1 Tax=Rotaria sordida TaxID=392033 RepID=A0A819RYU2_9BILA|nr:unnamed protein product [Rotaria sordida]CAF4050270.1 unnamed protein product [Rotaria sordida]